MSNVPDGFLTGYASLKCQTPCLSTTSDVVFGSDYIDKGANFSILYFALDEDVKTKIVSVDSVEFLTSLNYFGSNLGLLPGMGIFQMIEGWSYKKKCFFKHNR